MKKQRSIQTSSEDGAGEADPDRQCRSSLCDYSQTSSLSAASKRERAARQGGERRRGPESYHSYRPLRAGCSGQIPHLRGFQEVESKYQEASPDAVESGR